MWQTVVCCSLKQWGFRSIKLLHEDQQMGFSAYFFRTLSCPSEAHTLWQQWIYALD